MARSSLRCFAGVHAPLAFFFSLVALVSRRLTAAAPDGNTPTGQPVAPPPSRLKALWTRWKKYGWYGVGTLVAVDVVTLGSIYVALSSGVDLGE